MNSYKNKRILMAVVFISGLALLPYIVMLLWNAILPQLFQVANISYFQSLGLLILCRILFGSFRIGRRHGGRPSFANPEFREKLMNMSPEEKEDFKRKWKEKCGR